MSRRQLDVIRKRTEGVQTLFCDSWSCL